MTDTPRTTAPGTTAPADATPTEDAPGTDTTPDADAPTKYKPYTASPSLDPLVGRRFPAQCDYCAAYATMRRPFPGVYHLTTIHALGCPGLLHEEGNE